MQFLDVKTDYAFKKVFGSEDSKERLLSFLNSILTFPNNNIIEDINPQISDAFESINQSNMSEREYELQERRLDFIRVQRDIEDTGFYKGYDKGIEQEKINIAKNLLDILDNKTISRKTGLTIDIIDKLRII